MSIATSPCDDVYQTVNYLFETRQLFISHPMRLHDPDLALQVGMRHFNIRKNHYYQPIINLDKLWSLIGHEVLPPPLPWVPGMIRGSVAAH